MTRRNQPSQRVVESILRSHIDISEAQEALLRQAEEALDYLMDYIGQLERVIFPSYVDEAWEVTDGTAILKTIREHLGKEQEMSPGGKR